MQRLWIHRPWARISAAIVTLGLATLFVVPNATAVSKELQRQAKQMSNTAAKLFKKKKYLESAKLFEQAYELDTAKLVRLRNAGRAFEEAKDGGNALRCFTKFIKLTKSDKLRADAEKRIAKWQQAGAKPTTASGKIIQKPAATKPQIPAKNPELAAKKPVSTVAAQTAAPRSSGGPNWMITGAGAAIVASGAGLFLYANSVGSDVESYAADGKYEYPGGQTKLTSARETVSTNKTAAYAIMGVGALAAGAGVFLLRKSDPAKSALLVPTVGAGRVGATALIRF